MADSDARRTGTSGDNKKTVEGRVRLARYLAACGIGSRRGCEKVIKEGRVAVNGEIVSTPASDVESDFDSVTVDNSAVLPEPPVYIMLNKPQGYTCSLQDRFAKHLVSELLPDSPRHIFPVGRLDEDSEGVLICTNDGILTNRLLHPRYGVQKTYHVETYQTIALTTAQQLEQGIQDQGEFLQPEKVSVKTSSQKTILVIELSEGRKREIRRMCRSVGIEVKRLIRVVFGPLELGKLQPGERRELTEREVEQLYQSAGIGPKR